MDITWAYSEEYGQVGQVIETQSLWGETTCLVWLPEKNMITRVPVSSLEPIQQNKRISPDFLTYVVSAAKIADSIRKDVLLAPIESSVIPLPHQIQTLSRAIQGERVRYLLADEVGLGKTIEAGLIMRELKIRGLVKRVLVIAPKGLVSQWLSEMMVHFNEKFQLFYPEDLKTLKRLSPSSGETYSTDEQDDSENKKYIPSNPWQMFSQLIVPMDSVKPLDRRRGWSDVQIAEYNRERFEDLISAGWDMVIVDEAHRMGGSTDQVARYRLGQSLSEAAPYLLLLTATPHQGKTDAFHRLMSLVDKQAFPDTESVSKENVKPYVIRMEKRRAIDADGKPLFKPRRTELFPVSWKEKHHEQKLLYEAVTDYVRDGYNQALKEKRNYIGFLMILMQRLVVSSTRAIRTTLEKRIEVLQEPEEQLTLFPIYSEADWIDLDGQEQVETLLKSRLKSLKNERLEVKLLLEAASRCEQTGSDAKAEALLEWIYKLQTEEGDPDLKLLVFTEFVPTQEMLKDFLTKRNFKVTCINGSMSLEQRKKSQDQFAADARILISTDAGGEGLNLQFCHIVINYDIPWNPMRIEQRIGRVDRIGQKHLVRAINFVFENSVEHRVREILEEKLAVIFNEFGINKTGDVLDSSQAEEIFDQLYMKAFLEPEGVESTLESVIERLKEEARKAKNATSLLGQATELDTKEAQRLLQHPIPHWIERMTVGYLNSNGGNAVKKGKVWDLTWPDGEYFSNVVFSGKDAEDIPSANYLSLEQPRIRKLIKRIPRFVEGQPIPVISLTGWNFSISGYWSLWQIDATTNQDKSKRIMPIFVDDDDNVLIPTSQNLWNQLLLKDVSQITFLEQELSQVSYDRLKKVAETNGEPIYKSLVNEHHISLKRLQDKARKSFDARRKAINRIGLPEVRNFRLKSLENEEKEFEGTLLKKMKVFPELIPLIIMRVEANSSE